MGPNQYPSSLWEGSEEFRRVVDEYHVEMTGLARKVLRVLALTLGLAEGWFEEFAGGGPGGGEEPMAVLRLLRYPPQPPSSAGVLEKGELACLHRNGTRTWIFD
jgi:isopenicillin N synthase-like dioxygenase